VTAVLLHGQPGAAQDWDLVVEALAGRVDTIVPDRPGYGHNGGSAMGIAGNGDAVVALLDRAGVERAVIVGYSWSGAVALDVAQRYPDRVNGLVLVAAIGGTGSLDVVDRLLSLPVIGPVMTMGGLAVLSVPFARRLVAPVAADRLQRPTWGSFQSFVTEQRAMNTELPQIAAGVGSIATASVVVIGEADRVVAPAAQEHLARTLNGAVLRIPGCGHLIPWEAPGVIADAILGLSG
jgi:pimeloyl-ACP methyl ester carboxylesterase